MDAIITYVNGSDPIWQADYARATNTPALTKRFRDWGTLKYLLRGIETNMPFINNVYLIVSHPSQVPEWANTENLRIVLHKDIIPEEFLPTFNCNTILTHMHKIEGLDEKYIFFNDDFFPVQPSSAEDFFNEKGICFGFSKHLFSFNMYKKICRNADKLARKIAGKSWSPFFHRPQHICCPMLRKACEIVYEDAEEEIRQSITMIRENKNINEYVFLDYLYYSGHVKQKRLSKKHFSMASASPEKIASFIRKPNRNFVCINDVELSIEQEQAMKKAIIDAFETLLPTPSKFEL